MEKLITDILDFWFDTQNQLLWFEKSESLDAAIRERFAHTCEQAATGVLDHWQQTPEGALALIILLDQFPRNLYRDCARTFATDGNALAIAKTVVAKGLDYKLASMLFRKFIYMPYMHSEDLEVQEAGIRLFEKSGDTYSRDYAILHRDIIVRFGRFPHRNDILERESTDEEIEFLKEPGSSF